MEWKPDEDNGQVVMADDVKRDNAIKYLRWVQNDESVAVSPSSSNAAKTK